MVSFVSYFIFRNLFPTAEAVLPWLRFLYASSVTLFPSILAWICAVAFAYITNKLFVFMDDVHGIWVNMRQLFAFCLARLFTLGIDATILFICVDLTGISSKGYEFGIKIFSNVVVAVLNYLISKRFVFRGKRKNKEDGD